MLEKKLNYMCEAKTYEKIKCYRRNVSLPKIKKIIFVAKLFSQTFHRFGAVKGGFFNKHQNGAHCSVKE